jgi:hypothetical protein
MGAGGSVIEESDEAEYPAVASSSSPGKSLSSSSSSPAQVNEKEVNKSSKNDMKCNHPREYPQPAFAVSLGFWPSNLPKVSIPPLFKLQISYESLDFVTLNDSVPIIQFPYQNIICWGSSNQNFQF